MPIRSTRLITTQKVLKTLSVKSMEQHYLSSNDLAKSNYKAQSKTSGSRNRLKGSGVIELNRMTAIEAKLHALMNKLGNQYRRMHSAHEVGTVEGNE